MSKELSALKEEQNKLNHSQANSVNVNALEERIQDRTNVKMYGPLTREQMRLAMVERKRFKSNNEITSAYIDFPETNG